MLKTDDVEVNTRSFFPYKSALIGDEEVLEVAIQMLQTIKQDDRFSSVPLDISVILPPKPRQNPKQQIQ